MRTIGINQIIIYIMVLFAMIGAADRITGNRLGLGQKFEEGIMAMGILTITMAGILVLTPVLSGLLGPIAVPLFKAAGIDPAMFAGIFFAIDMGGAPLAQQLAADPQGAALGGILASSMLGATIAFTIPLILGGPMGGREKTLLAKGILIGVITIPLGVFTGGLCAGFPLGMVAKNTIPILIISLLLALGMWRLEKLLAVCFVWIGRLIVAVSVFGLAVGILQQLTPIEVFRQIMPLEEVFLIIGNIAILLAGAFPLVSALTRLFRRPLEKAGMRLGINQTAAAGFLVTLANSIPMYDTLEDMDPRGRVMNVAFSVSAMCALGDHLSYTAGVNMQMLVPLMIGKLTAGIAAAVLAWIVMRAGTGRAGQA